jgi:hypothetical protein
MKMKALLKRWNSEWSVLFWALASNEVHEIAAMATF